jgi:hypothetical protein
LMFLPERGRQPAFQLAQQLLAGSCAQHVVFEAPILRGSGEEFRTLDAVEEIGALLRGGFGPDELRGLLPCLQFPDFAAEHGVVDLEPPLGIAQLLDFSGLCALTVAGRPDIVTRRR